MTNAYYTSMKNIFQKMYRDVGMAVPKTTQTIYMDGSVQATPRTTQVAPSLHLFLFLLSTQSCFQYSDNKPTCFLLKRRCREGVTCVVLCVACTLPFIYLVCVVFGTAIPTSLYVFGKCFSYLLVCFTVPYTVPLYVKHQHL